MEPLGVTERVLAYRRRRTRATRCGLAVGALAAFGPFLGDGSTTLLVPRLLAGYLVGLLIGELIAPRAVRGAIRSANLTRRAPRDLLGPVAVVAPGIALLPLLAAPLLIIGWHPQGKTTLSPPDASCTASAYWPSDALLWTIAAVAALAIVAHAIVMRRLASRAETAEDDAWLRVDRNLRREAARSATYAAIALALALLSAVAALLDHGAHSAVCTTTTNAAGLPLAGYSWAASVTWLSPVSTVLLFIALVLLWVPIWLDHRSRAMP